MSRLCSPAGKLIQLLPRCLRLCVCVYVTGEKKNRFSLKMYGSCRVVMYVHGAWRWWRVRAQVEGILKLSDKVLLLFWSCMKKKRKKKKKVVHIVGPFKETSGAPPTGPADLSWGFHLLFSIKICSYYYYSSAMICFPFGKRAMKTR